MSKIGGIVAALALVFVTNSALAEDKEKEKCGDDVKCVYAPEIDPASAMTALTLLGGCLAVVRGRREKK